MRKMHALAAMIAMGALAQTSLATVYFTFQDPTTPLEFRYVEGDAVNNGTITYDPSAVVELKVDGSEHGFGVHTFNTTLVLDLEVTTATGNFGVFTAFVLGTFRFIHNGEDILTGTVDDAALVTFATAGAMISTSTNNSLDLVAGGALSALLATVNLTDLVPQYDASFSLANITPGVFALNQFGYLTSFDANAAFVGNAEVIPSPGSAALGAIAVMFCMPQRRRRATA